MLMVSIISKWEEPGPLMDFPRDGGRGCNRRGGVQEEAVSVQAVNLVERREGSAPVSCICLQAQRLLP